MIIINTDYIDGEIVFELIGEEHFSIIGLGSLEDKIKELFERITITETMFNEQTSHSDKVRRTKQQIYFMNTYPHIYDKLIDYCNSYPCTVKMNIKKISNCRVDEWLPRNIEV